MGVSVIIPVYNDGRHVAAAVSSALRQPEVAEILLVEDGSEDGSLAICKQLAEADRRTSCLRHPQGDNRGCAESRNLGIRSATGEFIAFLDADDHYLDGRFTTAVEILTNDPSLDGIYGLSLIHI